MGGRRESAKEEKERGTESQATEKMEQINRKIDNNDDGNGHAMTRLGLEQI